MSLMFLSDLFYFTIRFTNTMSIEHPGSKELVKFVTLRKVLSIDKDLVTRVFVLSPIPDLNIRP